MRKREKEIVGQAALEKVIKSCQVCRLALFDDEFPYIVPLNFGYRKGVLYFHGAMTGKKLSLLKANNRVGFEMDTQLAVVEGKEACEWGMAFQSIIGHGRISMIQSPEAKKEALDIIMAQYSDQQFDFPGKKISGTAVYKLEIEKMTGKQAGIKG